MKRLALALIAGFALWGGWWFWQAHVTRAGVEAWFAARRSEGWQASYDTMRLRGFPNRLDLTLDGVVLQDPDGGLRWRAPFVQAFQLVYKPGHRIFAFPPTMTVGGAEITSDGLRASLVEADGVILRANLEADVLNIAHPDRALALAGVTAGMAQDEGQPSLYRFGVAAEALAGPDGSRVAPASGDGLQLRAAVTFDRPWDTTKVFVTRPQPDQIDLRVLEYRLGGMALKLAGALSVDTQGRGDGDLTLRAENWRSLLDLARKNGQLPGSVADAMEAGLAMIAGLSGNDKALDLPLRFDAGRVMLGPVPLGQGPRLRLP